MLGEEDFSMVHVVIHQMLLFFFVSLIGFACFNHRIITNEALPHIARLMTKVLLPVMIFSVSYFGVTRAMMSQNFIVLPITAIFYFIASVSLYLIGTVMKLPKEHRGVFQLSFLFGNTGFVGAPLLAVLLPRMGGVVLVLFSLIDQALFWTYGVWLASSDKNRNPFSWSSLFNPNLIAIVLAMLFVNMNIRITGIVQEVLMILKNAVPAISMIYLGALFASSDWRTVFQRRELYFGILIKQVVLPIVIGRILLWIGMSSDIISALVVLMALPTMTVVPMIVETYGGDGAYASGITTITLAFSIVTIPIVFAIVFL